MVKNQIVPQGEKQEKTSFSAVIYRPAYQKAILNALSDHNAVKRFTASIVSTVTATPELQECDPMSIVSAGLLGESLNLSPSTQLGHYYFVPFRQKEKRDRSGRIIAPECVKATFILGYKGYIQLATRSGYYRKINVVPIKKGELISFNPLEEEIKAEIIQDEIERENDPTVGYYAMFEYLNGFRKAMYWSKEKCFRMRINILQHSAFMQRAEIIRKSHTLTMRQANTTRKTNGNIQVSGIRILTVWLARPCYASL